MKNLFFGLIIISSLVSCKKEGTSNQAGRVVKAKCWKNGELVLEDTAKYSSATETNPEGIYKTDAGEVLNPDNCTFTYSEAK